uniref:Uncharacterized protein n=1 Tax=Arundo donax TaxID=35708 RepID=A0A0A9HTG5_ARUDO
MVDQPLCCPQLLVLNMLMSSSRFHGPRTAKKSQVHLMQAA